jgi:hypothetical protein
MIEAFPLQWPVGFPRATKKKPSQFKCTIAQARDGIIKQIQMMKGSAVIISTNIPVKKDGLLYASGKPVDNDHGVAVYFTWRNEQRVLACDQYNSIWENLRAIENSIEAMRGLERWGCSDILARTFSGFKALPESHPLTWYEYMGISKNSKLKEITSRYREMSKLHHPDSPSGSHEAFLELKYYYEQAVESL